MRVFEHVDVHVRLLKRGSKTGAIKMTQWKERPGCLTAWLVLIIVGGAFASIRGLMLGPERLRPMMQFLPPFPDWYLPASHILALFAIVFAVGIWFWKRWAVYGYCLIRIIGTVLSLGIGLPLWTIGIGLLIDPGIMILLVSQVWDEFD
jgi:MFS superfamily sulfate permease-like transporter